MAVVTRASKGSLLTHSEMDTNFEEINLKADKIGSVLQVVSMTKTDANVYSSVGVGFIDVSNNELIIIPTSATSKILVQMMISAYGDVDGVLRIVRGSTAIGVPSTGIPASTAFAGLRGGYYEGNTTTMIYLDSPGTTNPISYRWQIAGSGSTTFAINSPLVADERTVCTITLMEIGA
jgi:hypothetical protein